MKTDMEVNVFLLSEISGGTERTFTIGRGWHEGRSILGLQVIKGFGVDRILSHFPMLHSYQFHI